MVRSRTSPAPGVGTGHSSRRKSEGLGSPTGRAARTMRLPWDMMVPPDFCCCSSLRAKRSNPSSSRGDRHSGAMRSIEPGISRFRVRFAPRNDGALLHPARIIRAFSRNSDVVDVAFAQARAGDAHELRLLVEFGEIAGADIAHRGAQAAGELVHDIADRPLVRHLTLDALRH